MSIDLSEESEREKSEGRVENLKDCSSLVGAGGVCIAELIRKLVNSKS